MTQQVYNLDWYAGNETVKYPIDSKASFVPTGYEYVPQELFGVITDISFNLSSTIDEEDPQPYLSALTITNDLLSLVINVGDTPVFAFSSTQRSLYINRYYTLTSFINNCSGVITFGESAKTHRCSYKFGSAAQAGFLPSVYHYSMNYPVVSIGKQNGAIKYQKDVLFKGVGDVQVTTDTVMIDDVEQKAIVFSLVNPEETSPKYIGPCDKRPESETCSLPSLEKINSIPPDGNGNINITHDGLKIRSYPGLLLVSSDYSLDDICIDDRAKTLFGKDECCDTCYVDEEGNEIAPPSSSTPSSTICNGSPIQHINFNTDVFASGIAIDGNGITPIDDNTVVYLSINKLTDLKYMSLTVARPPEGGFCEFSIIQNGLTINNVKITPTEVNWRETYFLLDRNLGLYPRTVTIVMDHCKELESIFADDRMVAGFGYGLEPFSIVIKLKRCSLSSISYVRDSTVAPVETPITYLNTPLSLFQTGGAGVVTFDPPLKTTEQQAVVNANLVVIDSVYLTQEFSTITVSDTNGIEVNTDTGRLYYTEKRNGMWVRQLEPKLRIQMDEPFFIKSCTCPVLKYKAGEYK